PGRPGADRARGAGRGVAAGRTRRGLAPLAQAARRRAALGLRGPLARGGRAEAGHPRGHGEVAPAPRAAPAAGGAGMSERREPPADLAARIESAAAPGLDALAAR